MWCHFLPVIGTTLFSTTRSVLWRGILLVCGLRYKTTKWSPIKANNCSCTWWIILGDLVSYSYDIFQPPHSFNVHISFCNQRQWRTSTILTFVPYFCNIYGVLLTKVNKQRKNILETCYVYKSAWNDFPIFIIHIIFQNKAVSYLNSCDVSFVVQYIYYWNVYSVNITM